MFIIKGEHKVYINIDETNFFFQSSNDRYKQSIILLHLSARAASKYQGSHHVIWRNPVNVETTIVSQWCYLKVHCLHACKQWREFGKY